MGPQENSRGGGRVGRRCSEGVWERRKRSLLSEGARRFAEFSRGGCEKGERKGTVRSGGGRGGEFQLGPSKVWMM